MFMRLSQRDAFGYPKKYKSLGETGVLSYGNNNNVKALLFGDGADESTVFTNSARGGNQTWSATANAQIDTAQKKFGTGSIYFPDVGSYISTPSNSDYQFGTGDLSIDMWFKRIYTSPGRILFHGADPNFSGLYHFSDGELVFEIKDNSILFQLKSGAINLSTSAFEHIMLTRNGNTFKLWMNGTVVASGTYAGSWLDFNLPFDLGSTTSGWMDNVRITKGVDVTSDPADPCYSENGTTYTVPTKPYK